MSSLFSSESGRRQVALLVFTTIVSTLPGVLAERHRIREGETFRAVNLILRPMNLTANPCQDFYRFACGSWATTVSGPGSEDRAYNTRKQTSDMLASDLKMLLESTYPLQNNVSSVTRAKELYASCMDESRIESLDVNKTLNFHVFSRYGRWPMVHGTWNESTFNLTRVLAKLRLIGYSFFWSLKVVDVNRTTANLQIRRPDLFLPRPSRYINLQQFKRRVRPYSSLLKRVVQQLNPRLPESAIDTDIDDVIELDWELADIAEDDDFTPDSHPVRLTVEELNYEAGGNVDWRSYFEEIYKEYGKISHPGMFIEVYDSSYLYNLDRLLNRTSKRVVANYLLSRLLINLVRHLPQRFRAEVPFQAFNEEQRLSSTPVPRWRFCVDNTNKCMRNAVGKLYVDSFATTSHHAYINEVAEGVRAALLRSIDAAAWFDNTTRPMAKAKAETTAVLIGYPDVLVNGSGLEREYRRLAIRANDYFGNVMRCHAFVAAWELNRIGRVPIRQPWDFYTAATTAAMSLDLNQITLSAGLLQPPFYMAFDLRALRYGSIGPVIGHEYVHGFGKDGKTYDQFGNENYWWTETTNKEHESRRNCVSDQYRNFRIPGVRMQYDSRTTNEEDVADVGGLALAYKAYKSWTREHGTERAYEDLNFTADQVFFIASAQKWCGKESASALTGAINAIHSPDRFRAVGPLSNLPEFAKAFNCPPNSTMNPSVKCQVW